MVEIATSETIKVNPPQIIADSSMSTAKKTIAPTNTAAAAESVKKVVTLVFLGMKQA
jgi:hypothetical protein